MSLRKVTSLGSNLASVTGLKRIQTPHSLCGSNTVLSQSDRGPPWQLSQNWDKKGTMHDKPASSFCPFAPFETRQLLGS